MGGDSKIRGKPSTSGGSRDPLLSSHDGIVTAVYQLGQTVESSVRPPISVRAEN